MIKCQKSGQGATPLPPPPLLGFTAISDHPRAGEVLTGFGPQSGVARVRIPLIFRSQAVQSEGGHRLLSHAHLLSLSKWTHGTTPFQGKFPKLLCSFTHLANTGGGKFRPGECKVKPERAPVHDRTPGLWFN
jgi:hypothetical protein